MDGHPGPGKEKLGVGREGSLDKGKQVVELLLLHLERRKRAKVLRLGKVKQDEIFLQEGGKENQEGEERHLVDKGKQVVEYL